MWTRSKTCPVLLFSALVAAPASAAVIVGDSLRVDYGSGAGTLTHWNSKGTIASTATDSGQLNFADMVRFSDGAATGVSFDVDKPTTASWGVSAGSDGLDNSGFFPAEAAGDTAFFNSPTTITFTFSGLDDALSYDVTFLSSYGNTNDRANVDWSNSSTAQVFAGLNGEFDHDAHTFTNLQSSGGVLTITATNVGGPSTSILLNAMQLDAVPEPATLTLLGLGAWMALGRRRDA